jgi:hypothetical protein
MAIIGMCILKSDTIFCSSYPNKQNHLEIGKIIFISEKIITYIGDLICETTKDKPYF